FVLAVSLEQPNETYGRFVIKRILRIYPPFAFAILVSLGLYWLIHPVPVPGLSEWFNNETWNRTPDTRLLTAHFFMLGPPAYETLDNVMWSLVHELRISVIFPLIVYCILRCLKTALFFSLIASFIALALAAKSNPGIGDWILTVHYAVLFFTGAA